MARDFAQKLLTNQAAAKVIGNPDVNVEIGLVKLSGEPLCFASPSSYPFSSFPQSSDHLRILSLDFLSHTVSEASRLAPSRATVTMLSRQLIRASTVPRAARISPGTSASLAVQLRSYATPSGPPPKGFRLPPPTEWDQEKEGTFTKAGKYFLLTEMTRGMYLLLEQFFRPP